jgi:hypothetical protein
VVTKGGAVVVHCDVCCLRVSVNKNKTLPKHYTEATSGAFTHGEQKLCKGSATTRYTTDAQFRGQICRRPRSKQVCPCCDRRPLTLNQNGQFPKHRAADGGRCSMSEANHPR